MENKRPGATPQRPPGTASHRQPGTASQRRPGAQTGSVSQRQPGTASQRRPGSTPQRRPPVRYPPPQNAVRSRPSPPPQRTTQPRAYPPPHIPQSGQTPPRIPKPNQTVKPRPAAKPEPESNFRDALWPSTPDDPALNRIAFVCGLLYALIHIACGVLLVYPLNVLTARVPFPFGGIVRALLPALTGAVLCALTRYPLRLENRVGLSAYRKLLRIVLTLFVCVLLLMWGDREAQKQVARFVLMFVSAPLIVGTALSVLLFYFDWLYDLDDGDA